MVKEILKETSPWWRHHTETFSAVLVLCEGNVPVTDGYPSQKASNAFLIISFILAETNGQTNNRVARVLRRHHAYCDVIVLNVSAVPTEGFVWLGEDICGYSDDQKHMMEKKELFYTDILDFDASLPYKCRHWLF